MRITELFDNGEFVVSAEVGPLFARFCARLVLL